MWIRKTMLLLLAFMLKYRQDNRPIQHMADHLPQKHQSAKIDYPCEDQYRPLIHDLATVAAHRPFTLLRPSNCSARKEKPSSHS